MLKINSQSASRVNGKTNRVVVIDSAIADYQSLSVGILEDYNLVLLDSERDGVAQISKALRDYEKIDSLHIVSHGSPGCLYLGNSQLSLDTLSSYQKELASWFALEGKHVPSLVIYGCNVAAGDAGEEFLTELRVITQANIAASTTKTGNSALEGNWNLEARLGKVDAALPFKTEAIAAYSGVFVGYEYFNIGTQVDSVASSSESVSDWTVIDSDNSILITDSYNSKNDGLRNNGIYSVTAYSPGYKFAYATSKKDGNYKLSRNSSKSFNVAQRQYSEIHLAAVSTEGSTTMEVTLNYTNGDVETKSISVPDWRTGTVPDNSERYYIDRNMDIAQKNFFKTAANYKNFDDAELYGFKVDTDSQKTLQSVTVKNTGASGRNLIVLGATGEYDDSPTVANTISQQTIQEDSLFDFTVPATTFSDPENDSLTYTATLADDSPLPDWLSFNPATQAFSGTPDNTQFGTISIKVTATDPDNQSVSTNFDLEVTQNLPEVVELANLNGSNGFKINGIDAEDYSGSSVSSAGDINADGIDDLIVGAPNASPNGQEKAGESYVVFGSDSGFGSSLDLGNLNGTNGFKINGIDADDRSGSSVSSAGDINADGIDDLIIGASSASPNDNFRAGESYVVFGSDSPFSDSLDLANLNGSNGFQINGIDASNYSGSSVSSAGDVNADGIDDLIIGTGGANREVYVVFGSDRPFSSSLDLANLNGTNGFQINGFDNFPFIGFSVSSAGDVNADGIDDLIIGANTDNEGTGASYVVFGSDSGFSSSFDLDNLDGSNGFQINGIYGGDRSGTSVSSAGDVNADGIDDLIIGAIFVDPEEQLRKIGASYVVFGSDSAFSTSFDLANLDGSNGFKIDGINTVDFFGWSVSGAGDVNTDGIDDIIVASGNARESYVVFGSDSAFSSSFDLTSLDSTNGFKIDGIASQGSQVGSAGDFNADGIDDLIIGASSASPNDNFGAGESYVLFNVANSTLPTVANEIADQTAIGSGFSFTIPETTFSDADGDVLSYSVSLADDSPLPGWLNFDPATGTLTNPVRPPVGIDSIDIKVTATDNKNTVSDTFTLSFEIPETETGKRKFRGREEKDNILGGGTPDEIRAGGGDDVVGGLAGKDRLHGEGGADRIEGGEDDDFIDGGTDNDEISGDAGVDFLLGKGGDDVLSGGEGDDILMGGEGNDTLYGGAGADRLSGFEGDDVFVLSGGDANNIIYDYSDGTDKFGLELSSFTESTIGDVSDALSIAQNNTSTTISYDSQLLATVYNTTATDLTVDDFGEF